MSDHNNQKFDSRFRYRNLASSNPTKLSNGPRRSFDLGVFDAIVESYAVGTCQRDRGSDVASALAELDRLIIAAAR